tara:strand:+ start:77 stop:1276 length:1200 start_codon:yes stop_codon:yes gene_type:complete
VQLEKLAREAGAGSNPRTERFEYNSEQHDLRVFKVDIKFPYYRLDNGRTMRSQQEYLAKRGLDRKIFSDQTSSEAQAIQHEILLKMIDDADLRKALSDDGQRDPVLLSSTGVVVNGNRRLAAMRILGFQHLDAVVLPDLPEKEISKIEMRLQMREEAKQDYNWVDELLVINRNRTENDMSIEEIRKAMNKQTRTVELQLLQKELLDKYLVSINQDGEYYRVEGEEMAFKTLAKAHKKAQNSPVKQNNLEKIAFNCIAYPEPGSSTHKRLGVGFAALEKGNFDFEKVNPPKEESPRVDEGNDVLAKIAIAGGASAIRNSGGVTVDENSAREVHSQIAALAEEAKESDIANSPSNSTAEAHRLLRNIRLTSETTNRKMLKGKLIGIENRVKEILTELETLG